LRHWLRFSRNPLSTAVLASALLLAVGAPSPAQTVDAGGDSPARFIPADDLVFYGEFDGLDAHSRGWQKTAAYRLLNETPTGAMLEDLFLQIYPRRPWKDLSAPEALQLIKHVAKSGVVISENCWSRNGEKQSVNALILRDAFSNKDVRPIFARLLQGLPAPETKPQAVVKLGHKMITGKLKDGDTFYWWVEETKKADLIIVFGIPEAPDYLIDTLDGKKPSALTNASRVELTKPRDGFERTGCLMVDPEKYALAAADHPVVTTFNQINTRRLDFLCGFQGDALATITRFHQKPNPTSDKSIAALFDKTTIPPIPSGVVGLTVLALDMKAVPAQIHKIKALSDRYDQFVATLKQKSKIRLEEDVLGQLGPKITAYIAPSKTPAAAPVVPNALSLMARMGAGSADALPKESGHVWENARRIDGVRQPPVEDGLHPAGRTRERGGRCARPARPRARTRSVPSPRVPGHGGGNQVVRLERPAGIGKRHPSRAATDDPRRPEAGGNRRDGGRRAPGDRSQGDVHAAERDQRRLRPGPGQTQLAPGPRPARLDSASPRGAARQAPGGDQHDHPHRQRGNRHPSPADHPRFSRSARASGGPEQTPGGGRYQKTPVPGDLHD